jgi:hypothetical protein
MSKKPLLAAAFLAAAIFAVPTYAQDAKKEAAIKRWRPRFRPTSYLEVAPTILDEGKWRRE